MKRKPTGNPTGTWCSNCKTDVMEVLENEVPVLHCQCTLGNFKTNLTPEALVVNHWKGMIS